MNDQDFFAPPPEGAVTTSGDDLLFVDYSAMKTPEAYVRQATPELMRQNIEAAKLGFHFYSKDEKRRISIHPMSFVILEVYSAITGGVQLGNGDWIQYWSNRVKDTRIQPFSVWSSGGKSPILSGIYNQIKDGLPSGAKFHIHLVAYCIPLERVVEIKLTAGVSRGIQRAIAAAEAAAGRTRKPEKVSLFGLADNDHLWGFRFTDFTREDRDGKPHSGKGDLYFAPAFSCGVVQPTGSTTELHALCANLQNQVRARHAERTARFAAGKPTAEAEQPPATAAAPSGESPVESPGQINTNVRANHDTPDDLPF